MSELTDFAEATGPFLETVPGRLLRLRDGYTLSADLGQTWAQVGRIRLGEGELAAAVADVNGFMHESGTTRASWWLIERSTPHEDAFLAAGLERDESDSTATWARGRGAYRAVVRARWDEAVRRGTPALAVGAGPMSRPILERLGFEQVLQFRRLESVRSGL